MGNVVFVPVPANRKEPMTSLEGGGACRLHESQSIVSFFFSFIPRCFFFMLPGGRGSVGEAEWALELDFAGGEGGLLHGHCAVAAQNGHMVLLLLLQSLLVPVVHGHGVKGWDEGHLWERTVQ